MLFSIQGPLCQGSAAQTDNPQEEAGGQQGVSRVPWLGIVDGDPCLASSVGYGSWGRGMPGRAAAVDQSEAAELRGRRHGGVPMTVWGGVISSFSPSRTPGASGGFFRGRSLRFFPLSTPRMEGPSVEELRLEDTRRVSPCPLRKTWFLL